LRGRLGGVVEIVLSIEQTFIISEMKMLFTTTTTAYSLYNFRFDLIMML